MLTVLVSMFCRCFVDVGLLILHVPERIKEATDRDHFTNGGIPTGKKERRKSAETSPPKTTKRLSFQHSNREERPKEVRKNIDAKNNKGRMVITPLSAFSRVAFSSDFCRPFCGA